MTYVVSIDWLAIYCHFCPPSKSMDDVDADDHRSDRDVDWEPVEGDGSMFGAYAWRYKLEDFGTRQFSRLYRVAIPNAEGGWDDFCEVQAKPHSGILKKESIVIRFVNRVLYTPDFWELAIRFLNDNHFKFVNISRIDLCADFNQFVEMSPLSLIESFAAKKLRHIGRGVGALYFNHGVMLNKFTGKRDYGVQYTGLSFGTHSSDARVYLYNKSFELLTQGDKPWIRDKWTSAGLDVHNVWRLEVSIKAKGCKFKERGKKEQKPFELGDIQDDFTLSDVYLAFVAHLFSFIRLPMRQKNITREPRVVLFDDKPTFERATIRNVSAGNRFERMFIKALWQLGDLYRGASNIETADLAQSFAVNIAESTDLQRWMAERVNQWERPTHK